MPCLTFFLDFVVLSYPPSISSRNSYYPTSDYYGAYSSHPPPSYLSVVFPATLSCISLHPADSTPKYPCPLNNYGSYCVSCRLHAGSSSCNRRSAASTTLLNFIYFVQSMHKPCQNHAPAAPTTTSIALKLLGSSGNRAHCFASVSWRCFTR